MNETNEKGVIDADAVFRAVEGRKRTLVCLDDRADFARPELPEGHSDAV